ncbi:MAG TPA: hypothetical protein VFV38_03785 [Ktedonobacteraceae bacterium]|nr:hypothetical protein [Ktedonobacteraceae bacterium]
MAFAMIPNQGRYELPDELFALPANPTQSDRDRRDGLVRRALSQFVPSALNANLTYSEKDGVKEVQVTPRLGTKAADLPVGELLHRHLCSARWYLDPALRLAWEIRIQLLTGNRNPLEVLFGYRSRLEPLVHPPKGARPSPVSDLHEALKAVEGTCPAEAPVGF